MNPIRYNSLHYVLIILLMFAPLRSLMAEQLMSSDITTDTTAVDSFSSSGHCRHQMQARLSDDVLADVQIVDLAKYSSGSQAKSCCDNGAACMSDCHFAMSASLFMKLAEYTSALRHTDTFDVISGTLLLRELSPPSRPPLSLHS